MAQITSRDADVIVDGAGLSGLIAARNRQQLGRRVTVLEARDRVGGRLLNHEIADGAVSAGARAAREVQDAL